MKKRKCPVCSGTGYLNEMPKYVKEMVKLRKAGLSLRQVGKAVGLSANTILYHLRKWEQEKYE